jgi:hypothetical protein
MAEVVFGDEHQQQEVVLSEEQLEDRHQGIVLAALAHFRSPQGRPYSAQLSDKLRTVRHFSIKQIQYCVQVYIFDFVGKASHDFKFCQEFKYRYLHYQSLNSVKIDGALRREQQRCLADYRRTIETVLEGPFR